MKKHYRKENDCLNCRTTLEGRFCHNCGQENLEMKESFGHMMTHAISDYFHFDDQFFHTLKPLLFKPGKLTNEYNTGHRAGYLHPVKMYIFISIVYFLLLFQTGSGDNLVKIHDTSDKTETKRDLDSTNKELAKALKNQYIPSAAKEAIQKTINQNNALLKKLQKDSVKGRYAAKTVIPAKKKDNDDDEDYNIADTGTNNSPKLYGINVGKYKSYQQYLDEQKKLPEDKRNNLVERMYTKKMISYHLKYGVQAKDILMDEFRHNIPKMMFLMLPLFALILKLTFWRNHKFYVEHMIYSFHLHCFLFLFLAIMMLLQLIIPGSWGVMDWLYAAATFYIIWYIYRSLRVVYQRNRFRTITKMLGMSFSYFFMFLICMSIALFMTAVLMPMAAE